MIVSEQKYAGLLLKNSLPRMQYLSLAIVMFLFGFGWAKIYVPALVLYMMAFHVKSLSFRMHQFGWLVYLLAILFVCMVYILGMPNMTISSPIGTFSVVLFLTVFIVPIFNRLSVLDVLRMLMFFMIGLFVYVSSVLGYTLFTDPFLLTHSTLANPYFPGFNFNTAGFSNYLSLIVCFLIYQLFSCKRAKGSYFLLALLILVIIEAALLNGRTFFLLLAFVIVAFFLKANGVKVYLLVNTKLFIIISIMTSLLYAFPDIFKSIENKFQGGLESSRYVIWQDALQKIPDHPVGGFMVDQSIEAIGSYHNIILDVASMGGWFPALLLLCIMFFTLIQSFFVTARNTQVFFLWMLSFICLLDMMQDVILVGTYKFFVLYIVLNILVMKFLLRKQNSNE